jgi:hypothetical protein
MGLIRAADVTADGMHHWHACLLIPRKTFVNVHSNSAVTSLGLLYASLLDQARIRP